MFEPQDLTLLKKLKLRTLLDLALLLPSSYTDTTLSKEITPNKDLVAKVRVLSKNIINNRLYLELLLLDFNQKVTAIFFKTTPYHLKLFEVGSIHTISGRVNYFKGSIQITQPKSLKSYGKVDPTYKSALSSKDIKELIKKYITKSNLEKYHLTKNEIETLLLLHFPKSINDIKDKDGNLKKEHINNLKHIEALNYILKLRKKRVTKEAKKALNGSLEPFFKNLPFKLTNDQLNAIKDIQKDLNTTKKAARRVIIGDVGSGKTMVILAAATIANKDKAILMAPTSILANQLYEEAKKYLSSFLKVAIVTQKQESSYKEADFIIGTHALLYKKDLPKAALVMVDEQHRFGTNQRAMLDKLVKEDNKSPHFLQFSATPIPRTQAMIDSEAIDISLIKQLPFKKQIETKIINKSDFKSLLEHINSQIEQNRQVLIVYPLIEPSDEIPYTSLTQAIPFWQKRYKNLFVTYGKDKDKDEVLLEFKEKGDILLSTTVIEVGISLPRLTTIVIVGAERFGLASLHQLRGRVGRYGLQSYCFLYTNHTKPPQRLVEFSNILDGFEIARLDLKYRNSGDLLDGTIQSGKAFKWLDLSEDEDVILDIKSRIKPKKS